MLDSEKASGGQKKKEGGNILFKDNFNRVLIEWASFTRDTIDCTCHSYWESIQGSQYS